MYNPLLSKFDIFASAPYNCITPFSHPESIQIPSGTSHDSFFFFGTDDHLMKPSSDLKWWFNGI